MSGDVDGEGDTVDTPQWRCDGCGRTKRRLPQAKHRPFCKECEWRDAVLLEMKPIGPGKAKFAEHGGDL